MQTIIYVLICLLAIYGIYEIMYKIALFGLIKWDKSSFFMHKIVVINDNSIENIEEFIRDMKMIEEDKLILIDKTENEESKRFLRLIEKDFSFVEVVSPKEYKKYIDEVL